jgi:ABC-type amino acid transport substrate-binding protein
MKRFVMAAAMVLFASSLLFGQQVLHGSIAQIPGMADSPESGVFVDFVKALDEVWEEGTIDITVVPFARSFESVMRGDADFHIPSFINPEVPESVLPFSWPETPMGIVTLLIYSNERNPITMEDIEAAMAAGGEFPYIIEVGAGTEGMFLHPVQGSNSTEQSLRKVQAGRVDAYIWPPEGDLVVREFGLDRIHREIYSSFADIIVVAKSPRGEEVAGILNDLLLELDEQGLRQFYHDQIHFPYEDWQPHEEL